MRNKASIPVYVGKRDVRVGSIVTLWRVIGYFRFSPDNGHGRTGMEGQFGANKRH